jgi:hypothetical protein
LFKILQKATSRRQLTTNACQLLLHLSAEAMAATTAKDMPRTVAEVQACKRMIQQKYAPPGQAASMQDLPPWPELKPQPQRA